MCCCGRGMQLRPSILSLSADAVGGVTVIGRVIGRLSMLLCFLHGGYVAVAGQVALQPALSLPSFCVDPCGLLLGCWVAGVLCVRKLFVLAALQALHLPESTFLASDTDGCPSGPVLELGYCV